MVEQELHNLIQQIQSRGCEEQTTEGKAARGGCPEKLYDTISAFSNQNGGGVFVFGLDEKDNFKKVGVYDAQDLQKKVMEYCEQMTPGVRPVFTACSEDHLVFVSAEIPPVDITDRPCFKTAKGRLHGSYIRRHIIRSSALTQPVFPVSNGCCSRSDSECFGSPGLQLPYRRYA